MAYLFKISFYIVVFAAHHFFSADIQCEKEVCVSKEHNLVDELLCNRTKCSYSELILANFKKTSLRKINQWIDTIAPSNDVQFLSTKVPVRDELEGGPSDRSRDGFKKAIAHCINGLQIPKTHTSHKSQKFNLANTINLYEQLEILMQKKLIKCIDGILPTNTLLLNPSLFSCNLIDVKMKIGCSRDSFKDSMLHALQNI